MEMKELYKTLLSTFEVGDMGELAAKIFDATLRGETGIYDKYLSLCPDLDTDYMRAIWEYYEADREEKKQDYTPACLGDLLSGIIGNDSGIVYDCCAGTGALTIRRWLNNKDSTFICEELDERVIPFLLFNLAVRNIRGHVIHGNALEQKQYRTFELTAAEKYSTIKEVAKVNISADFGISNPPYNIKWAPPAGGLFDSDDRFAALGASKDANYAFVFHVLSKIKSRAAFILPCSVLDSDEIIRKAIIDKGFLEAVILLPEKLFINTSIATCILVFDKVVKNEKVVFIDARKLHGVEVRKQRGEGDIHYHRIYSKSVHVLTPEHIEEILNCISEKGRKLELCAAVHAEVIKESDYDITPKKYIEYIERREPHRPLKDIVNDINRCRRDKNMMKITINKNIARSMGLDTLAELAENGNKITDDMNNMPTLKNLGFEFIREDYITLSKHNELRIENTSKEYMSHLFAFFLPEFSNHIYYLNARENEYLAELRDAMLPGLMSGDIAVTAAGQKQ